jgi:N-acetylglucosamine-6-phosphate deacetylase
MLIKNCKIIEENGSGVIKDILIKDGKIDKIEKNILITTEDVIDAKAFFVVPGFIDVHIQGAGGSDILDGEEEALYNISKCLAKLGTTAFLATTVIKPDGNNRHLEVTNKLINKNLYGASILGFHLEGPFINPIRKGGIDARCIYPYTKEEMNKIFQFTDKNLRMMTIAPELNGNLNLINSLVSNDIIASFGHSDADYDQTRKGISAGINHVTHIFNAMRSIHHRNPGPIPAIFEDNNVSVQIISDGYHVHPSIIKMIYKIIGSQRCICITDGVQAMGLPEGNYVYNGKDYISKGGAAKYFDGTLIGSTLPLGKIAKRFMDFSNCTLKEAVDTITINPARLLKVDNRKGSIEIGKDADIVIMDNDFNIKRTIIMGKEFKN